MLSRRLAQVLVRSPLRVGAPSRLSPLCSSSRAPQIGSSDGRSFADRPFNFDDSGGLNFASPELTTPHAENQIFFDDDSFSELKRRNLGAGFPNDLFSTQNAAYKTVISVLDGKADRQDALDLTVLTNSLKWVQKKNQKEFLNLHLEGWFKLFRDCLAKNFSVDQAEFELQAAEHMPKFVVIFDKLANLNLHTNGLFRMFFSYEDVQFMQILTLKLLNVSTPSQITAIVECFLRFTSIDDFRRTWHFLSPMFVSKLAKFFQEKGARISQLSSKNMTHEEFEFHNCCLRVSTALARLNSSLDNSQVKSLAKSIVPQLELSANLNLHISRKTQSPSSETAGRGVAGDDGSASNLQSKSDELAEKHETNLADESAWVLFKNGPEMMQNLVEFKEFAMGHTAAAHLMVFWRFEDPSKDLWSDWFKGAGNILDLYVAQRKSLFSQDDSEESAELFNAWGGKGKRFNFHDMLLRLCSSVLFAYLKTENHALFGSIRHRWVEALNFIASFTSYTSAQRILNEIQAAEYLLSKMTSKDESFSTKLIDDGLRQKLSELMDSAKQRHLSLFEQHSLVSNSVNRRTLDKNEWTEKHRTEPDFDNGFRSFANDDKEVDASDNRRPPDFGGRRVSGTSDDRRQFGHGRRQPYLDDRRSDPRSDADDSSRPPSFSSYKPDRRLNYADRRPDRFSRRNDDNFDDLEDEKQETNRYTSKFAPRSSSFNKSDQRSGFGRRGKDDLEDFDEADSFMSDTEQTTNRSSSNYRSQGYSKPRDRDFSQGYSKSAGRDFTQGYSKPGGRDFSQGYSKPGGRDFSQSYSKPGFSQRWSDMDAKVSAPDSADFDSKDSDDFGSYKKNRSARKSRPNQNADEDSDFL